MASSSTSSRECFDRKSVERARRLLRKNKTTLPRMAELYKLLANPVRLQILLSLGQIDRMCVGDLAAVVDLSIAATSHQLKLLRERGWLSAENDGKMVYYSLANQGLTAALEGDLRLLGE